MSEMDLTSSIECDLLKVKRVLQQLDFKILGPQIESPNNFQPLAVVDRVSETQLQVGENSNLICWRLKR